MRQAGIVAAAGIYALNNCVERLAEDHRNAKKIGYGILLSSKKTFCNEDVNIGRLFLAIHQMASLDVTVNLEKLETNIVLVDLNCLKTNAKDFVQKLFKVSLIFEFIYHFSYVIIYFQF